MRIITILIILLLSSASFAEEMETVSDSGGVKIKTYEPLYFLVGTNPENSKFQLNFKVQIFNAVGEGYDWLNRFNIGYTQTSFWDLKTSSAPFKDTSYKPELFYLTPIKEFDKNDVGFYLQTGVRHESNGRGGDLSRSTNSVYLRPSLIMSTKSGIDLALAPRLRGYFNNDEATNPDLPDYRGHFDLDIQIGKKGGLMFDANIAPAKKGTSVLLDLSYPVIVLFKDSEMFKKLKVLNTNIYLQAQYVNTLAESLINYQKRTRAFRLGFAVVREKDYGQGAR